MSTAIELQSKLLTRSTTSGEYKVYDAAFDWDLVEPIVIQNADDLKSKKFWRDRITPYHHQVTNLITFCRRLPVTLLADDVGLGKTSARGYDERTYIPRAAFQDPRRVCPKLLGLQWKEELETKSDIPAEIAIGRELLGADHTRRGDDYHLQLRSYASRSDSQMIDSKCWYSISPQTPQSLRCREDTSSREDFSQGA